MVEQIRRLSPEAEVRDAAPMVSSFTYNMPPKHPASITRTGDRSYCSNYMSRADHPLQTVAIGSRHVDSPRHRINMGSNPQSIPGKGTVLTRGELEEFLVSE